MFIAITFYISDECSYVISLNIFFRLCYEMQVTYVYDAMPTISTSY